MNDASPDVSANQREPSRAYWPLRKLPLDVVPPLAGLTALAALLSMVLNQVVLPALGGGAQALRFPKLSQVARFSANLAVTAGLITLVSCVSWALLGMPRLALRRQMFVFVAAGVLVQIALSAMLFDPLTASRAQIYFAVAASNVIGLSVGSAAVSGTRGSFLRVLAAALTTLAALNLATVLLDFVPDAQLDPWTHHATTVCKAASEIVYLALLLAAAPLLVPKGMHVRALIARSLGFAVLVLCLYAQITAQRALHADYALLIYSAQRLSLFLDHYPLAYSAPFCLVLSSVTTGLLGGGAVRIQAASGMLLIFAAGHSTRAPGRLLSLAVGFMLLSRALIAFSEHAPFRSVAPPARNTRRPPTTTSQV
jgi:hypothetical protein